MQKEKPPQKPRPPRPALDAVDREAISMYYYQGEKLAKEKLAAEAEMKILTILAKELKILLEKKLLKPDSTISQAVRTIEERFNDLSEHLSELSPPIRKKP